MQKEITLAELDGEFVELVPERETLKYNRNRAHVVAINASLALNLGSNGSEAYSTAGQIVVVNQD